MGVLRSLLLIVGLSVLLAGPSEAQRKLTAGGIDFGRYRALVIGVNDYAHLPPLETAVNDASALHDLLRRRFGFESKLLLNPDRYTLVSAFDELRAELGPEDNLLIFYAGHGYLDPQTDEGFWLPIDAEEDRQANWVAVSTVTRSLKALLAKHVLVVSDSCFSGTLTRSAPVVLPSGPGRMAELQRVASKRARKALTSGGLEPVADNGGDGHSVFTRALLHTLSETKEAMDGYQLFSRLRRAVTLNSRQTPLYGDIRFAGDEGGDFVFLPLTSSTPPTKAEAGPVEPRTDAEAQLELAFWNGIKDSASSEALQAFLRQFPDGSLAPLARLKLEEMNASRPTGGADAPTGDADKPTTEADAPSMAAAPNAAERSPAAPDSEAPELPGASQPPSRFAGVAPPTPAHRPNIDFAANVNWYRSDGSSLWPIRETALDIVSLAKITAGSYDGQWQGEGPDVRLSADLGACPGGARINAQIVGRKLVGTVRSAFHSPMEIDGSINRHGKLIGVRADGPAYFAVTGSLDQAEWDYNGICGGPMEFRRE